MTNWEIHGHELANCNCASGCPCQFLSKPTQGNCEAAAVMQIDKGHYGDVDLSGTKAAMVIHWPGAIPEGNGTMQIVIDEKASREQREALQKIMTGQDTDDMATMFWVFSAMSPNKLETLFKPISFKLDMAARRGTASVQGVFETEAEPLVNPITGAEHRIRIHEPNGFEFHYAEIAKGTTKTTGEIELANNKGTHVHMNELHLSNHGVMAAA